MVLSQVPPGFTRARLRPGLRLYYQVETLIFGRAMERALHPERFIVGCADPARAAAAGIAGLPRGVRLSDPAHALGERGADQDRHQLLPRVLDQRRQHAGRAVRGHRRRVGRDRACAQARPPHRPARLPEPRASASPAATSSATWRPSSASSEDDRQRRRRGSRLDRQQPASARLGGAHHQARAAGQDPGGDGGGVGPRLQGEHQLGEELPVAGHAAPAAGRAPGAARSRRPGKRGRARVGRPAPPSRCKPSPAPMR